MAHGKETPRQKMIGMMYLVLTALLALNVSKEAVEAFKLIDESLNKTINNFNVKNNLTYGEFDRAAAEFPVKAGPWRNKAYEVKERSKEVFDLIQELKLEIVRTAEGDNPEIIEGNVIHTREIKKIDENNIPSEILIGPDNNGKAYSLKAALDEYREFLLGTLDGKSPSAAESIEGSIDTHEHKEKDGTVHEWEYHNFHALPLVAVVAVLSKLQNDVKNAEAEAINFLYTMIDEGSFKFNKLVPTVIAKSNYIQRGTEYTAEVFIAATDTTQKPDILVGDYDSTLVDGIMQYQMKGTEGSDYDKIPIDNKGRGIYTVTTSTLGDMNWGGLIQMVSPTDGSTVSFPFKAAYQVAVPSVVVSPTAMNILYIGLDNPIDISVPGVTPDNIRATISSGTLSRGRVSYSGRTYRGSWVAKPRPGRNEVQISVRSVKEDGSTQNHGSIPFRVKNPPPPIAKIAGLKGGNISLAQLTSQVGLAAEVEDFEFDIKYVVTSFTVGVIARGLLNEQGSTSYRFTDGQLNLLRQLRRGSTVQFTQIRAVGPTGETLELPAMVFKIN
jgi:gliding motility-associated protein GldM